jgi:Ca-activated chloride channel homolog
MQQSKRNNLWPALPIVALAFLFLGLSLFIPSTSAQKTKQLPPPPPPLTYKPKPTPTPAPIEYDVVRVNSNLVVVPVSVTDAQGQPVLGLKAADFHIEEDGRSQQVAQLGDPEQVPLDIALLVDVSGSVVARFDFEQQAAASFIKHVLKPEDRATVYAIDDQPRFISGLTTADVAAHAVLTIKPANSYTAYFDSVLAATKYLDQSSKTGRRRIAVIISDGDDTARILDLSAVKSVSSARFQQTAPRARQTGTASPSPTPAPRLATQEAQSQMLERANADTQREVQRAEVTFYSINPSGQTLHLNVRTARAEAGMERIAAATGGASFIPAHDDELVAIFNRIAAEIRSQYLLQYYSDNQTGATTFRHITVTSPSRSQLRVRAREGYYPKGK